MTKGYTFKFTKEGTKLIQKGLVPEKLVNDYHNHERPTSGKTFRKVEKIK